MPRHSPINPPPYPQRGHGYDNFRRVRPATRPPSPNHLLSLLSRLLMLGIIGVLAWVIVWPYL